MAKSTDAKKSKTAAPPPKPERYIETTGGRKTAAARVRLFTAMTDITVNGRNYRQYFKIVKHQQAAVAPLELMKLNGKLGATVRVTGGGIGAQAAAMRHGLARALTVFNPDFRKRLRGAGFLTRDSRMVERKKYGLKKARRAPQWAKR